MFKETHLKRVNGDDASFMSIRSGLITSAKEYFHKRFSNFQEDPVLRGAADLSNPMLWPRERQDLLIFGENKLTDKLFSQGIILMNKPVWMNGLN